MIGLVSPISILALCWGITVTGAWVALAFPERFDLVAVFLLRQSITPGTLAPMGAVWLALALATWTVADRATAIALPAPRAFRVGIHPDRAARTVLWATLLCVGVTALWVVVSSRGLGGPIGLARLALDDPDSARDHLLRGKLFPGMRLAYAALPGTGAFAAALLALGGLTRGQRRACMVAVALSGLVLLLLPVVMSQRLLTLQFAISTYLAICLVRGRLLALGWLGLGAAAFAAVWIMREAITNPSIDRGMLDIALQKALYYTANDLWNSFEPLGRELRHTGGALTFSGLAVLTATDGLWSEMAADRLEALETMKGGGEFSLLTTAFVDFGVVGGTVEVAVFAVLFRLVWHAGLGRFGAALAYSQIGAALFFSSHGNYVTHQNLLTSLGLIWVVLNLSRISAPERASEGGARGLPV